MDSARICYLVQKLIQPSKCEVLGVFPIDLLQVAITKISKYPACCIVNIHSSTMPGLHWVAYYFESADKIDFFDPHGHAPRCYGFSEPKVTSFHNWQITSKFRSNSGIHCLYYLYTKAYGKILYYDNRDCNESGYTHNDGRVKDTLRHRTHRPRKYKMAIPNVYNQTSMSLFQYNMRNQEKQTCIVYSVVYSKHTGCKI